MKLLGSDVDAPPDLARPDPRGIPERAADSEALHASPSGQRLAGARCLDPLALLSTMEVSILLGVAEVTLRIWRLKGCGPRFVKLGRSVRYRRGHIEQFLEAHSVGSTSEGPS